MKKCVSLVMVFMIISITAIAQSDKVVIYTKPFLLEHELRLGYSPLSILALTNARYGSITPGNYDTNITVDPGASSLIYTYKPYRWLEVGASFVYAGYYISRYMGNEKIGADNRTHITITPTFRFSWFNRRNIRLYSSFSFGGGIEVSKDNSDIVKDESVKAIFAGQITPFGLSAGRKVFFFIEPYCVGTQGVLCIIGLGYRFPAKQQNQTTRY